MWIDHTFQHDFDQDEASDSQKAIARIQQVINVTFTVLCPLMTILSILIIPAVYEDIKDNIFLLLGGNRNLWDNFYNLTLTMSALKIDIIANLEFWTTFFFLLYTIDYSDAQFPKWAYWSVYGTLLFIVLLTDIFGYRSVSPSFSTINFNNSLLLCICR